VALGSIPALAGQTLKVFRGKARAER